MSAAAIENDLRRFSTRLLEETGAMVEWSAEGSTAGVLAPPAVAKALHAPGEAFEMTTRPAAGGLCVSLAGEFLDVAGQVLQESVPRIGTFHLGDRYLKKGDVADWLARAYSWPNARVRFQGAGPARIEYQTWHFHASLRSEDCFETRVSVALNARSQATIDLPDVLEQSDLAADPTDELPPADLGPETAGRVAAHRALEAAAGFLSRMDARLARDERRLRDYYQALVREAAAPNRRTKTVASPESIAAKKQAVQLELARKLGELRERYQMTLTMTPLAVIRCRTPVLALELDVTRKRSRKTHTVYWNPLLKALEPLACARCGRSIFCVYFSEDEVAPFCRACWEQPSA